MSDTAYGAAGGSVGAVMAYLADYSFTGIALVAACWSVLVFFLARMAS